MTARGLAVVAAILIASAAAARPPTPSRAAATAGPSKRPALELTEVTILYHGSPIARLHADGRTESVGNNPPGPHAKLSPGPVLHPDGTIVFAKAGVRAHVDPSGAIYVTRTTAGGSRDELFGRIAGDRFSFAGASDWMARIDGDRLVYHAADWPPNDLRGATTAASRRAVLVMLAAFYLENALTSP